MWPVLLAQSTDTAPVEWLNFGTAGLVVVSFLLGWIWPKPAVDRLVKENERLHDSVLGEVQAMRTELRQLRQELGRDPP